MSEKEHGMRLSEKITITVSVVGLLVALTALLLGEAVLKALSRPDIYVANESISLDGFGTTPGHLQILNFYNAGSGPSKNTKIVAKFSTPDIQSKIESDESIKGESIKGNSIEVLLDRLSPRSGIRISVASKNANPVTDTYYIDDKGKSQIALNRRLEPRSIWIEISLITLIVLLVLLIARALQKSSERRMLNDAKEANIQLDDKLNAIQAELANIRPPSTIQEGDDDTRAVRQKLKDILG